MLCAHLIYRCGSSSSLRNLLKVSVVKKGSYALVVRSSERTSSSLSSPSSSTTGFWTVILLSAHVHHFPAHPLTSPAYAITCSPARHPPNKHRIHSSASSRMETALRGLTHPQRTACKTALEGDRGILPAGERARDVARQHGGQSRRASVGSLAECSQFIYRVSG